MCSQKFDPDEIVGPHFFLVQIILAPNKVWSQKFYEVEIVVPTFFPTFFGSKQVWVGKNVVSPNFFVY